MAKIVTLKETVMPKAPKAPKAPVEPRKIAGYLKTAKISIVATENPKRNGSSAHTRFAKYRNGMTIQSFLDSGGTTGDVNWDLQKGYIKLAA